MNPQIIRQRVNENPRPFVFRLSDGSRVKAVHPDFLAIQPGLVYVVGPDRSTTKIDPLHVVAIEERPEKSPKPKRRR